MLAREILVNLSTGYGQHETLAYGCELKRLVSHTRVRVAQFLTCIVCKSFNNPTEKQGKTESSAFTGKQDFFHKSVIFISQLFQSFS